MLAACALVLAFSRVGRRRVGRGAATPVPALLLVCLWTAACGRAEIEPTSGRGPQHALSEGACGRGRGELSDLAAGVLDRIESNSRALAHSSVPAEKLLSLCNRFDSVRVEGPAIYGAARNLIASAD